MNKVVTFRRSDAGQSESKYAGEPNTCVAIALAHATLLPFEQTYEMLFDAEWMDTGWKIDRWLLGRKIAGLQFIRRDYMDKSWLENPLTVEDFCGKHGLGTYLVSSIGRSAHMSAVINGVVHGTRLCPGPIRTSWRLYRSEQQ